MSEMKAPRVLWLLNHGAARKFEIAMLKKIGIQEIFTPKSYPNHPSARSASVDFSEDQNLTLPPGELEVLNQTDWYGTPSREAWEIANRRFDVLFSNFITIPQFKSVFKNFQGSILWRAFGTHIQSGYSLELMALTENHGERVVRSAGERFWFAQAYEDLHVNEPDFLKNRRVYLPLGMQDCRLRRDWSGEEKKIFFVCPDIGFNPYYETFYRQFIRDFQGFDYAVGGVQPVKVRDPRVLGFVTTEAHERNMRQMRVMYYPSREPNHVHYHPFEAVRAGMPLLFMAGGLLDRLGGKNLPGRCKNIKEARNKIGRILQDDRGLIEKIRETQICLLEPMKPENCEKHWAAGFQQILSGLEKVKSNPPAVLKRKTRLAVLLPVGYRGGSLGGAKLLAAAIEAGARQAGEEVEVVLGHLDEPGLYNEDDFSDLAPSIKTRPYHWRILERAEAKRAMAYGGIKNPLDFPTYQVPEDGIHQFMDCDLWLVVSDRLENPLLPVRDYVLMVYDYLQRYQSLWPLEKMGQFIWTAYKAQKVWVTSEFTKRDALQFVGLAEEKVVKLPMIAPEFPPKVHPGPRADKAYFVWTTNLSPQKNQEKAFKALRSYYEKHNGGLECYVTGVGTRKLLKSPLKHLKALPELFASSDPLKRNLKIVGDLSKKSYQDILAGAEFLWHAGIQDNGTYSVVEAAYQGVPSLSSDYPAMREIESLTGLGMRWMDPYDPEDMSLQLKKMEKEARTLRSALPAPDIFLDHSVEKTAGAYWQAVKDCL